MTDPDLPAPSLMDDMLDAMVLRDAERVALNPGDVVCIHLTTASPSAVRAAGHRAADLFRGHKVIVLGSGDSLFVLGAGDAQKLVEASRCPQWCAWYGETEPEPHAHSVVRSRS